MPALMDRSRAPLVHPKSVADDVVAAILELRKLRPSWGPKKLRERLCLDQPEDWPSEATFARILKRNGLTEPKRKMRRTPASEHRLAVAERPNDIWCADFKGKFRVDRRYCHPLTITDAFSRFVLCCYDTGGERLVPTKEAFKRSFEQYGLPRRMRSDNGTPFASTSLGGLSRLSVWWIKLGILPERTRPGCPQDNGRHERMHRTLKAETATPPRSTLQQQQQAFDDWRDDFNRERPHEALNMRMPVDVYETSPRPMPKHIGDPDYPGSFDVRRVRRNGCFKLNTKEICVGSVLRGEAIGIEPIDDARWQLWFGPIYLGLLMDLGRNKFSLTPNRPYAK
jgi:transposase InsO family protein